jgi:Flp pilus assembly protein TadB
VKNELRVIEGGRSSHPKYFHRKNKSALRKALCIFVLTLLIVFVLFLYTQGIVSSVGMGVLFTLAVVFLVWKKRKKPIKQETPYDPEEAKMLVKKYNELKLQNAAKHHDPTD